jgi:2-polyprenyl-3-methyl-5-hydroxy-6-metoxy-1,4-benzoquinol methylase
VNISTEKTAIGSGISGSIKYFKVQYENKDLEILDYGCGRLRNSINLLKTGYKNVSITDTDIQLSRCHELELIPKEIKAIYPLGNIKGEYDIILCLYVLNVISDINERNNVMNNIKDLLRNKTSRAIIEVRTSYDILGSSTLEPYKDGYIVGKNKTKTFQKPYTKQELQDYLLSFDFVIYNEIKQSSGISYLIGKK